MKKIRVLQSVNSLGRGGTVIFVINFFRHIDKSRFQVDFVIYDDTKMEFYDEVLQAGSRVFVCRKRFRNKFMQLLSQIWQVKRLLKKERYDMIHCHSCSFIGIFRGAIPGFLTKGVKVVSHAHSVGTPTNTFCDKVVRQLLKTIVSHIVDVGCACSDIAGKSKYCERFIHSGNYLVINNAIDTDDYQFNIDKRKRIREKLGITAEQFVVGNVGRLEHEKNHIFLLEVFKLILNRKPGAVLVLVGDGSNRLSLERKAEELKIKSNVIFLGACKCAADYYQAMDCFVLPSYYEGFPFVLVEAQVNGLRCIVSDNMTKDVNISGGVVFKSLNEEADDWADSICEFGSRRMERREVEQVIEKYELSNEVLKFERLYMACVTGDRSIGDI